NIRCRGGNGRAAPIEVEVDTDQGKVTKTILLNGSTSRCTIQIPGRPKCLTVDHNCSRFLANGGVFTTHSFQTEPEHSLIVYGTADEVPAQREAAEALQRAIRRRGSNITVPIKADKDVTDADLKTHHLLLIGRPDSNRIVERVRTALPIKFGSRSFVVRGQSYANAKSAVIVAAENRFNNRYSVVVAAGLSAEATHRAAPRLGQRAQPAAEVLLLVHGQQPRALVVPARELVREVNGR